MGDVTEVEVVVAHSERATLRVGDVFLKVDADQARIDVEVEAMSLAPVPTPEVLWRKPRVLAIAALPGTTLGRLGGPSTDVTRYDLPIALRRLRQVGPHLRGSCPR